MLRHLFRRRFLVLLLMALLNSSPLTAGDFPLRGWTLGPSVGVHWGTAYEIVYDNSGVENQNDYMSLLVWELNPAVMAGVESRWESGRALGLDLNLRTAIPGMSVGEMNDYDWLYTDRDWSHWSVSDVDQRFGFILDAVADWQIAKTDGFRLRLGVGYHLDWWGWTDTTKDSVYSTTPGDGDKYTIDYPAPFGTFPGDGWRDDPDVVPTGVNGINYNTAYHVPLVSLTAALEQKVFFLRADGRIGPVIALGKDHHLRRYEYGPDGVYFYDSAFGGPWIDTSLETGFRTAGRFSFTLRGEYAWLNETRGNTTIVPTDGSPSGVAEDTAGFSFQRAGVSVLCSWSLGSSSPDQP